LRRLGRERDADGVADAFLQQHRQRRRGGHDALAAHAGLGQAQVQRIAAAHGEVAIDRDQLLHAAHLRRQDDAVLGQADLHRALGRIDRRAHQRLAQHAAGVPGLGAFVVLVHQLLRQRLVERAPVHADAHRLVVPDRELDDRTELRVALASEADVAGVDAVLRQRLRAGRFGGEQLVPL
jgi:hypothetical protein